jgi:two-component system chemotaxis sensor kinase CheA
MASKLRHIGMFSGNTILGDGSVIMIIDPNGVSQEIGASVASTAAALAGTEAEQRAAAENTVSLLVFRAGSPEPKAVPLSLVTRLEEIDCKKIELSNGRHMVQYRGQLMPLIRVSDEVKIKREGAQPLLVFSDGNRSMGLVVDEIVDIIEDKLEIEVGSDRAGVLGSPWCAASHGNHRRRSFPAARLCRLVPRQGHADIGQGANASPGRRLGVLPQHAFAGSQGRWL